MNKISFSWNLIFKCNYRCQYCWFHKEWQKMAKHDQRFSKEDIIKAWRRIHDNYGGVHIDILGGEPFLYPNFVEIIQELSRYHILNISTNLSVNIKNFIAELNPEMIKIQPSFHPSFADLEKFIEKLVLLKKHGFNSGASLLAYPPHLSLWDYFKSKFEESSVSLSLMPFWGRYKEIDYPGGYTDSQRRLILGQAGYRGGELFQAEPRKIKKGSFCRAGQIYGVIKSDGTVKRCGMDSFDNSIGNIFDQGFKLLESPLVCESEYCPCNEWTFLLEEKNPENEEDVSFGQKIKSEGSSDGERTEAAESAGILFGGQIGEKEGSVAVGVSDSAVLQTRSESPGGKFPFKVHWNWEITHKCNYKCGYCHFWREKRDSEAEMAVDRWGEIWERIFLKYGCCHIRFSGGEPTIYPGFFDLVSLLNRRHTIDITTNLSFNMDHLVEKVDPASVIISPSYHPEADRIEEFIRKILFLRKNGFFTGGIAYVAYPAHLSGMLEIISLVEKEKIEFKIIPFHGEFSGRQYPGGYSAQEKALLRSAAENSISKDLNMQWLDWNIKDGGEEDKKNESRQCRMGQLYAKIFPDGKVTRCCSPESEFLGNILDDGFEILDQPKSCDIKNCPCFKAMFLGNEEKYSPYWGSPKHPVYNK